MTSTTTPMFDGSTSALSTEEMQDPAPPPPQPQPLQPPHPPAHPGSDATADGASEGGPDSQQGCRRSDAPHPLSPQNHGWDARGVGAGDAPPPHPALTLPFFSEFLPRGLRGVCSKEGARWAARGVSLFSLFIFPWIGTMEDARQQRTLGILLAAATSWLSQILPITSTALLIAPMLVIYGVATPQEAFYPYADPLLFLFYGAFFMAKSMQRHGLDRRLAGALWRSTLIRGVGWRLRLSAMCCGGALSMWISNTATAASLIPIVHKAGGGRGGAGSILAVAYACSIGGTATIIGTPPNLIALRLLESEGILIDFISWMKIGLPCAALLIAAVFLLFLWLHPLAEPAGDGSDAPPPDSHSSSHPPDAESAAPSASLGVSPGAPEEYTQLSEEEAGGNASQRGADAGSHPGLSLLPSGGGGVQRDSEDEVSPSWSRGEVVTLVSFGLGLAGWLAAPAAKLFAGEGSAEEEAVRKTLHVGVVAMLASSVLFCVEDGDGRPVLPWEEASKVDWGIIMLFGGGISLGSAMKATGLAEELGLAFVEATGVESLWAVTAIFTVFTVFFTEVCSNTASANILVPLVIGVCAKLQVSPVPPCIGVALAASCAFMMPISTGPNAVAYSTGAVSWGRMAKTGIVINIVSSILLVVLLRLLCPLYGWADPPEQTTLPAPPP